MNYEYENIPGFKEIPEKLYQTAHDNAWSKENMAGHDAEGRSLEYMGGRILKGNVVFNFYLDDHGDWWYKRLDAVKDIGIVPPEYKLFGAPETRKTDLQGRKKKRWPRNFLLSSTSAPDTSEEEYLDTAAY